MVIFVWCFLQGTEEIVGRVSFGYYLAPSLFKERKGKEFKGKDNDRPFRIGRVYRETTQSHQLRRDSLQ